MLHKLWTEYVDNVVLHSISITAQHLGARPAPTMIIIIIIQDR